MDNENFLCEIAKDAQEAGVVDERVQTVLRRKASFDLFMQVNLAHSRSREAVVKGTRQALRGGCLLQQVPYADLPGLLRSTGISQHTAEAYIQLAERCSEEQRGRLLRRRGRISEDEALELLKGTRGDVSHNLVRIMELTKC